MTPTRLKELIAACDPHRCVDGCRVCEDRVIYQALLERLEAEGLVTAQAKAEVNVLFSQPVKASCGHDFCPLSYCHLEHVKGRCGVCPDCRRDTTPTGEARVRGTDLETEVICEHGHKNWGYKGPAYNQTSPECFMLFLPRTVARHFTDDANVNPYSQTSHPLSNQIAALLYAAGYR